MKAIAIGNGLTDPYAQYPGYATFAYENNLVGKEKFEILEGGFKACQALIYESESGPDAGVKLEVAALEFCNILMASIQGNPAKFNQYDIRIPCEVPGLCYDFSAADALL